MDGCNLSTLQQFLLKFSIVSFIQGQGFLLNEHFDVKGATLYRIAEQ